MCWGSTHERRRFGRCVAFVGFLGAEKRGDLDAVEPRDVDTLEPREHGVLFRYRNLFLCRRQLNSAW